MAFIPIPNTVKVCFTWILGGQTIQTCIHVKRSSGAPTDADLVALSDAAALWWTNTGKPNFTTQMSLTQVTATDLTTQAGHQAVKVVSPAEAGTGGATALINNVAAVLSLRTAGRGRSRRGRMYLAGMDSGTPSSPVDIGATWISNILADFGTLISNLEAATSPVYDAVVASRQENGVVQDPGNTFPITTITMDTHFDSQRRRLATRGI